MKNLSVSAKYSLGMAAWMTFYVAAIIFDGFYFRSRTFFGAPQAPWLYVLAVMPALPIGGTIWSILRFMEKSDEYVRAILTRRFILATGATLFLTTAWGFLQNYANVQRFDLYYVYILFWVCFAVLSPFTRGVK